VLPGVVLTPASPSTMYINRNGAPERLYLDHRPHRWRAAAVRP
jgi:hypothetical protein